MPGSSENEFWNRKEVARLLRLVETERRYWQEMVLSLPVPVAVVSGERAVLWANPAFRQWLGMSAEDVQHKRRIEDLLPAAPEVAASITSAFESDCSAKPVFIDHQGDLFRVGIQLIRDWTEESDRLVLLTAESLAAGAGSAPGGGGSGESPHTNGSPNPQPAPAAPYAAWTATPEFRFTLVTQSLEALANIKPDTWISDPGAFASRIFLDDRPRVLDFYARAIQAPSGGVYSAEFRLAGAKPGLWFRETILFEKGQLLSGVITEITARRDLEALAIQNERIEAMRGIVRKIAHEANNQLTVVNGYADELIDGLAESDPNRAAAREIATAGTRLGDIVKALQTWARPAPVTTVNIEVGEELAKAAGRVHNIAAEFLEVEYTHPTRAIVALAEPEKLETTILQLVKALVEGGGGKAHIHMSATFAAIRELAHGNQPLAPGRYVEILLANRHPGYKSATHRPFESPIPGGGGGSESDQELTAIYRMVQEWGGLVVRSATDGEIRLYLKPAHAEPATDEQTAASASAPAPGKTRESILVVDNEPSIRGLVCKILRDKDYEVADAANGKEAVEWLQRGGRADLLITDVDMPHMDGKELAWRVNGAYPGMEILYISGNPAIDSAQFPPRAHFLAKPFTSSILLRKVREILDGRARSRGAGA